MKVDHKREVAAYSAPRGRFAVVEVPQLSYLMVDGHGDPNTSAAYREAVGSIYPLAYRLKFLSKTRLGRDHVVMPLEALWTSDDMASFTTARDASRWAWTLMVMVPDWITVDHLAEVRREIPDDVDPPRLDDVRLEHLDEGLCVQTLHVGPYDAEGLVLEAMHHEFIPGHGLRMTGRHHEIYLGDARRVAPERLRTILRQPVQRV